MAPQEIFDQQLDLMVRQGVKFPKRSEVWLTRLLDRRVYKGKGVTFTSTFGNWVVIPDDFWYWSPAQKYVTLVHEAKHVEQYKRCGFGNAWFGWLVFGVLYILCLPAVFTLRSVFERQVYELEPGAIKRVGLPVTEDEWCANVVKMFTGWYYFFMCPFPKYVEKWARRAWKES